ncbi:hypothetical protein PVAG01_08601 [Phlyctema vagabunda]|uniref:Uncharacterized protein n=1 Tax=Phlyctema vagabunda TaxID=108571 RepID=A0ABR4PA19_9HELO
MSSTGPVEHRDVRSASQPFKRDRDHGSKWSLGVRPSGGVQIRGIGEYYGGSEAQRAKVRPEKQWSGEPKSHQNKTPKSTSIRVSYAQDGANARLNRKVDALVDAKDHTSAPLSKSLLELLPQHSNNKDSAIKTAWGADDFTIPGVLYSYDTSTSSPTETGRAVALGGLVEQAEKKWKNEQTEKIIKGEYEVLDNEGKTTVLSKGRGKKGSPKQRTPIVVNQIDEDDGFELI